VPRRPLHPCNHPGCPALTHARFCEPHERKRNSEYDAQRGSASSRGYGVDWQAKRERIFARDRNCRACGKPGTKRDNVDHVVPKRRGGTDDDQNLQRLCHGCHSTKTAAEDGRWG
jgi:5-methylcytosine-specific restriction enzyme A